MPRKEGGRGLAYIQDRVDTLIERLEYIKKHGRRLITATRNNTDNTSINRTKITRKSRKKNEDFKRLTSNILHEKKEDFKRLTSNILHEKTRTWLRKRNLKRETESLQIAAQNSTIRFNYVKAKINKTQQSCRNRFCDERDEMINHIISERSKLAQSEYKTGRARWYSGKCAKGSNLTEK